MLKASQRLAALRASLTEATLTEATLTEAKFVSYEDGLRFVEATLLSDAVKDLKERFKRIDFTLDHLNDSPGNFNFSGRKGDKNIGVGVNLSRDPLSVEVRLNYRPMNDQGQMVGKAITSKEVTKFNARSLSADSIATAIIKPLIALE